MLMVAQMNPDLERKFISVYDRIITHEPESHSEILNQISGSDGIYTCIGIALSTLLCLDGTWINNINLQSLLFYRSQDTNKMGI